MKKIIKGIIDWGSILGLLLIILGRILSNGTIYVIGYVTLGIASLWGIIQWKYNEKWKNISNIVIFIICIIVLIYLFI